MEYCSHIWGGASRSHGFDLLDEVQTRVVSLVGSELAAVCKPRPTGRMLLAYAAAASAATAATAAATVTATVATVIATATTVTATAPTAAAATAVATAIAAAVTTTTTTTAVTTTKSLMAAATKAATSSTNRSDVMLCDVRWQLLIRNYLLDSLLLFTFFFERISPYCKILTVHLVSIMHPKK